MLHASVITGQLIACMYYISCPEIASVSLLGVVWWGIYSSNKYLLWPARLAFHPNILNFTKFIFQHIGFLENHLGIQVSIILVLKGFSGTLICELCLGSFKSFQCIQISPHQIYPLLLMVSCPILNLSLSCPSWEASNLSHRISNVLLVRIWWILSTVELFISL